MPSIAAGLNTERLQHSAGRICSKFDDGIQALTFCSGEKSGTQLVDALKMNGHIRAAESHQQMPFPIDLQQTEHFCKGRKLRKDSSVAEPKLNEHVNTVRSDNPSDKTISDEGISLDDSSITNEQKLAFEGRTHRPHEQQDVEHQGQSHERPDELPNGRPHDRFDALLNGRPHDRSDVLLNRRPHDRSDALLTGQPYDRSDVLLNGRPHDRPEERLNGRPHDLHDELLTYTRPPPSTPVHRGPQPSGFYNRFAHTQPPHVLNNGWSSIRFPHYPTPAALTYHRRQFSSGYSSSTASSKPDQVWIEISNLDFTLKQKEWCNHIQYDLNRLKLQMGKFEYCTNESRESTLRFTVDAASQEDVVKFFNGKSVGYRKLVAEVVPPVSKKEIHAVFNEIVDNDIPLHVFMDKFKMKYGRNPPLHNLFELKSVVDIAQTEGGRRISLTEPVQKTIIDYEHGKICVAHTPHQMTYEQCLQITSGVLPIVSISLQGLEETLHQILLNHPQRVPLVSLEYCRAAVNGSAYQPSRNGLLNCLSNEVSLEHLINASNKFEIMTDGSDKYLIRSYPRSSPGSASSITDPLVNPNRFSPVCNDRNILGRQIIQLIEDSNKSIISMDKLIPLYHNKYGKQLNVKNYGAVRLLNLILSLKNYVEVLGFGPSAIYIHVSHRYLQKLFTADCRKVLESNPDSICRFIDFPNIYLKVLGKHFLPSRYGMCTLEDLFTHCLPNKKFTVHILGKTVALIKQERTVENVINTREFQFELYSMLLDMAIFRMNVDKFIPAYHHNWGKQCSIKDYGFDKLIELFHHCRDVVNVVELGTDTYVELTQKYALMALRPKVEAVIFAHPVTRESRCVLEEMFLKDFEQKYQFTLQPIDYGCETLQELLKKVHCKLQVTFDCKQCRYSINYRQQDYDEAFAYNVIVVLWSHSSNGRMRFDRFCDIFELTQQEHMKRNPDLPQVQVPERMTLQHKLYPAILLFGSDIILNPWLMTAKNIVTHIRVYGMDGVPESRLMKLILPQSIEMTNTVMDHERFYMENKPIIPRMLGWLLPQIGIQNKTVGVCPKYLDKLSKLITSRPNYFWSELPRMNKPQELLLKSKSRSNCNGAQSVSVDHKQPHTLLQ